MHRSTRAPTLLALVTLAAAGMLGIACSASKASSTGTGSGGTGTGGSVAAENCATLCATEATLKCANSTTAACTMACETEKAGVSWCTSTVDAAVDCLAKEPATSFVCDMNGLTVAQPSACPAQLAAIQGCWYNGPAAGLPDMTQACNAACAAEAALPCVDPNCAADCLAGVKPGQKCNGALAALVACAAKQDASSFACDMGMPSLATVKPGFCDFVQLVLLGCLQQP